MDQALDEVSMSASGQFAAMVGDSVPALVVGFFKGPLAPVLGTTSILVGIAEAPTSWLAPVVGVGTGGALIIMGWFANAVKGVLEDFLKGQGKKLFELPDADALDAEMAETRRMMAEDKKNLTAVLEDFARGAAEERKAMQEFRLTLAKTLENHSVRIRSLEGWPHDTGETPRG